MRKYKERSFETKADYVKRCTLQAVEIIQLKSIIKQLKQTNSSKYCVNCVGGN